MALENYDMFFRKSVKLIMLQYNSVSLRLLRKKSTKDFRKKIFRATTGGVRNKNTHNKNQERPDWLVFFSPINSTVCAIRTRTIRTFLHDKNAHNKNF